MAKGGKRGPRGPKRPADVVFTEKMENTFKTATNLLAKLHGLQRHTAIRSNGELRARYGRLVDAIVVRVQSCAPTMQQEPASETLDSWTQTA